MMSWVMEWVDITTAIVALILMVFGALSGLILWLHKKMKKVAQTAVNDASGPQEQATHRLGALEGKVGELSVDVRSVRVELHKVTERVAHVERTMQTDIAEVKKDVHGLKAAFETQMSIITGQINMLYQAALDARPKN